MQETAVSQVSPSACGNSGANLKKIMLTCWFAYTQSHTFFSHLSCILKSWEWWGGGLPWAKWMMRQIMHKLATTLLNIQRLIVAGACLHNATCSPAAAPCSCLSAGLRRPRNLSMVENRESSSWGSLECFTRPFIVLLISTGSRSAGVHNAHLFILRVAVIGFEVHSDQCPPPLCSWTLTCSHLWRAAWGNMHRSVWAPPRWFSIVRSLARRGGINSCSRYFNVSSL